MYLAWFSKLHSTSSKHQFEENIFFENILLFKSFLDIDRKKFGFLWNCIRRGCQNCILGVQRIRLKKTFFFEVFILFYFVFDIDQKLLGLLSKCFRRACQNCILSVHCSILKNFSSKPRRTFGKLFLAFWPTFFWKDS